MVRFIISRIYRYTAKIDNIYIPIWLDLLSGKRKNQGGNK